MGFKWIQLNWDDGMYTGVDNKSGRLWFVVANGNALITWILLVALWLFIPQIMHNINILPIYSKMYSQCTVTTRYNYAFSTKLRYGISLVKSGWDQYHTHYDPYSSPGRNRNKLHFSLNYKDTYPWPKWFKFYT